MVAEDGNDGKEAAISSFSAAGSVPDLIHRTEADAEKRDAIILMHLHRIAEHMEALMQNQEALVRHVESIGSLLNNLGSRLATIEQEVRKIHK
ncbi:hypothetical protein [Acidithiobacillus sulfuriphilus]|uniref:hypothetical protein n=1 Tax=Acidithiobacillus sulfuriphilus TaxID=1867749 RepID=UPI003F5FA2ED